MNHENTFTINLKIKFKYSFVVLLNSSDTNIQTVNLSLMNIGTLQSKKYFNTIESLRKSILNCL